MTGSAREAGCDAQTAVTSDPDIFRAAKLLIDQNGEDAPLRVVVSLKSEGIWPRSRLAVGVSY
jgi:hypothetical protein